MRIGHRDSLLRVSSVQPLFDRPSLHYEPRAPATAEWVVLRDRSGRGYVKKLDGKFLGRFASAHEDRLREKESHHSAISLVGLCHGRVSNRHRDCAQDRGGDSLFQPGPHSHTGSERGNLAGATYGRREPDFLSL